MTELMSRFTPKDKRELMNNLLESVATSKLKVHPISTYQSTVLNELNKLNAKH